MYDTLDEVREDIAQRLSKAAEERNSPMHTAVVATSDADLRVMVLRAHDDETGVLRFHTDIRAPKATLIGDGGPVGLLFYDKGAKIQIRIRGAGRIESDTRVADAAWEESDNFARRCYLGEGPGAVSDIPTSGLPDWAEGIQPSDEQVAPARANFSVLLVEPQSLDWFYLAHSGHIRAQFEREASGWEGRWVAP